MHFRNLGIVFLGIVILAQPAFGLWRFNPRPRPNPIPRPITTFWGSAYHNGYPRFRPGSGTLTIATANADLSPYGFGTTTVAGDTLKVLDTDTDTDTDAGTGELFNSAITVNPAATFDVDDFASYSLHPVVNQPLGGAGTVKANTLQVLEGTSVTPGDSNGTLTVDGEVVGNINPTAGSTVTGSGTVAGALAAGSAGRFDQTQITGYTLRRPSGSSSVVVLYEDTNADAKPDRVRLLATLKGDANGDRVVDVIDLDRFGRHYGQAGAWQDGDFNYDGVVDVLDLGALGTNWLKTMDNETRQGGDYYYDGDGDGDGDVDLLDLNVLGLNWFATPIVAPPTPAPEPASLVLLGLGGLALVRGRARG